MYVNLFHYLTLTILTRCVCSMSVPTLNLGAVQDVSTPPVSGSGARRVNLNVPSRGLGVPDALLATEVTSITDVAVLQQKLLDAQRLFLQLEQRYERSLEAKQRKLSAISNAMAELMANDDTDGAKFSGSRVGRTERAVQVGYPSVPSSLSTTPRSTREPTSARLRIANRAATVVYPQMRFQATQYVANRLPGPARQPPMTATATGPVAMSPRPTTARNDIGTPTSPYRPYQAATRRVTAPRATTPRY
jgi:hypothetical protein